MNNDRNTILFCWVIAVVCAVQGALISMHTPAVLTFLHMLVACIAHLLAVSYLNVPAPQLTSQTWKGAPVHVTLSALQVGKGLRGIKSCDMLSLHDCISKASLLLPIAISENLRCQAQGSWATVCCIDLLAVKF